MEALCIEYCGRRDALGRPCVEDGVDRRTVDTSADALSERSAPLVSGAGPPGYIAQHISRLPTAYAPGERPDGYICLAISEHKLAFPLLRTALAEVRAWRWSISTTGYDNPRGNLFSDVSTRVGATR
jgi:hypothetical protein